MTSRQAELLDKAVMGLLREPRKNMALDVFAAISHKGTFRRASKGQAPRAMKAEAVPNAIQDVIAGYRHAAVAVGASIPEARYAPRVFKDAEVLRIGHLLRLWHAAAAEAEEPGPTAAEDSAPRSLRASRQLSPAMPEVVAAAPPPAESAAGAIAADAGDDVVLVCQGYGGSDLEARVAYGEYGRSLWVRVGV